jgi:hypothetical protein
VEPLKSLPNLLASNVAGVTESWKLSKLLIGIPSPRDLPNFTLAINTIPHDKIWAKYIGYKDDPYGQLKKFFMEHTEYSHFAICPDDLIPNTRGVAQLWEDAQKFEYVSGLCNVNLEDLAPKRRDHWQVAVTSNLPTLARRTRKYLWMSWGRVQKLGDPIAEVQWTGTPFAIISRRVMGLLSFTGDMRANNTDKPTAYDVGICHELQTLGIPIRVDTRVFFPHWREYGNIKYFGVGTKEKELWYDNPTRQVLKPYERKPFSDKTPTLLP